MENLLCVPSYGEVALCDARVGNLALADLSHHHSLVHNYAAISHSLDEAEILLDDYDSQSLLVAKPANNPRNPLHDVWLDTLRRLVEQDETGVADENPCDS